MRKEILEATEFLKIYDEQESCPYEEAASCLECNDGAECYFDGKNCVSRRSEDSPWSDVRIHAPVQEGKVKRMAIYGDLEEIAEILYYEQEDEVVINHKHKEVLKDVYAISMIWEAIKNRKFIFSEV